MKKNMLPRIVYRLGCLVMVVAACELDHEALTPEQLKLESESTARDNSQLVVLTQDVIESASGALAGQPGTGGRASEYEQILGHAVDCAPSIAATFNVDRSNPDQIVYSGTLTIDFGDGSTCADSTSRKRGKIIDRYVFTKRLKDSIAYSLEETLTFEGFQKDSVLVDGTFISKSTSGLVSTLEIQEARLTYPDETTLTWRGTLTNTFQRKGGAWNRNISKEVVASLEGTNRSGLNFSAVTGDPIFFNYACSRKIPVRGILNVTMGSMLSIVDFGEGDCDKLYTITTEGETTVYRLGGKRHHDNEEGD